MTTRNFVVKNGLAVGTVVIDAASGNLTGVGNANLGNLVTANFFSGAGNLLSNIQGGNVTGQVGNALIAGTVYSSAQSNITSLGTLTGLTVNGLTNLGPNGNITITGGTSGQFLQTNGSGNLSWTTIVTSGVSNGTSNIDIPVASGNVNTSVGGVANVFVVTSTGANVTGTFNSTGTATVGNVSTGGTLSVTGNANVGNLGTGGLIVATGNVTGGNLTTAGAVAATGNVSGGNLTTAGAVAATGNVSGGNLTTAGAVAATGNVSGGNLTTAGVVAATGNVSGANITTSGKVVASSLESNVATGTAPLVVASTTKVTNLNADLLDGHDSDVAATANTVVVRDANANIAANNISGTLSTAAQPNVTSVGTLSSLDVTGNITTSANVVTDLIVGKTTGISIAAAGSNQNVALKPTGSGVVDVWGAKVSNVATPVASTDAATKGYVDAAVEGLHIHAPCAAATPATLATITSGTITYNNGSSGVGATLTTTGTFATIDGVNIATGGTRILVKDEANAAHNGIYVFTSSTVITRAADFDTPTEMGGGDFTFVQNGTIYNDTGWVMTDPVTTVGTTPVNFLQFSGAGEYSAGTGLTLTGTQFSITNTAVTAGSYGSGDAVATFTVNAQGQLTLAANTAITSNAANLTGTTLSSTVVTSSLTTVGTLGSLAVTGNATAGNVYANSGTIGASLLTGTLTTAAQPNVTSVGTLSSLAVTGNATAGNVYANSGTIGASLLTGTLTTAAQPNITSVGTLSSLAVTGNASAGNLTTTGALSVTGNANVGNIGATNGVFTNVSGDGSALSSITGGNVTGQVGNALVAGTVYTAAQPNITSVGTLSSLGVSGNITAANITANTGVFTGNAAGLTNIPGANVSGQVANALVAGTVYTNAQPNITSVGTLTDLGVSGNITAANITANTGVFTGNAAGLTNIPGANVSGAVAFATTANSVAGANVSGQVGNALVAGTVYTNAQPNITSVGTLTSLAVTGNVTAGNVALNGGLTSNRSNVAVSGTTAIDQFAPGTFRTAKYIISASGDDGFQSVETLLVHDGVNAYITIYGSICSNVSGDIIELSANIADSNVKVYATTTDTNVKVNLVASYIQI